MPQPFERSLAERHGDSAAFEEKRLEAALGVGEVLYLQRDEETSRLPGNGREAHRRP